MMSGALTTLDRPSRASRETRRTTARRRSAAPGVTFADPRSAARFFRLGRLLHLLRLLDLFHLLRLLRLLGLGDFVLVRLVELPDDVIGRLFCFLHLAHDVPELHAQLLGDRAPPFACLSERDDLLERRRLAQGLVGLHQLLRKRQRARRLSVTTDAIAKIG